MNKEKFAELTVLAMQNESLKKIIFSRPQKSEALKISGRLCAHRGRRIVSFEYSLPGNTVSQKNISEDEIKNFLLLQLDEYRQANLLTALGDAEYKVSKGGADVLLGGDKLKSKLLGKAPSFESAIEALDKKKNYILSGDEDFLKALDISDKNGRIHDKKQGKFRQINRFLEHIEDIYTKLPKENEIKIYDLCCGKSYLSFAVYYYLTAVKGRKVYMLGIDLKRDVIAWCDALAKRLNYNGMHFVYDDVKNTPSDIRPDMVISLHACDIATDIVINRAMELGAKIILSTPCCHRYLNGRVAANELSFVTDYPQLSGKLCEAMTDALRLLRMRAAGYSVTALELTDPENTPKNTLLRGIYDGSKTAAEIQKAKADYEKTLEFLLGENSENYLKEIR